MSQWSPHPHYFFVPPLPLGGLKKREVFRRAKKSSLFFRPSATLLKCTQETQVQPNVSEAPHHSKSRSKTLVMKFGGASVSTVPHFDMVADIIRSRLRFYPRICAVVSAMANATDNLIALAHQVTPEPPEREYDMLISAGERISCSLLAMALDKKDQPAYSFTGSQAGIVTNTKHTGANILEVKPWRLSRRLDKGEVVVVAGFQGVSIDGEITTLGRGGSDTSAVALAIALGASHVEFFKDVEGIYSADPKKNVDAQLFQHMKYSDASALMESGAKVLHSRAVRLAARNELPLHVLSFLTYDGDQPPGTVISHDPTVLYRPSACIDTQLYEEDV